MRHCGRTVAGKQGQHLDLISNRAVEMGQHPGLAGDLDDDKGGTLHTAGWGHWSHF